MQSFFNKFTLKQTLGFVSIVVLFSMFFVTFREGLEGNGTIKPQISPGRCDAAKSCSSTKFCANDMATSFNEKFFTGLYQRAN